MIIAVGSTNIVKIDAVESAFKRVFPDTPIRAIGREVVSFVRHQPFYDGECITGARHRAHQALLKDTEADFAVGIESGICRAGYWWFERGWVTVVRKDLAEGIASTASCIIPDEVAESLRSNPDDGLGSLLDRRLNRTDVKCAEGYIGVVTNSILTRSSLYVDAVILACVPFINTPFFKAKE